MIDEKLMKKIDRTYFHIKDRCYNKRGEYYHLYGGRGITMCDDWFKNKQSFIDWSINNGVAIGLSIDRIDCDGNYSPENCRWVDMKVQNNNRRNNIKVEYKGKTYSIIELSELLGIKYRTLVARLKDYHYKVDDIINRKLWERVNKKSKLNEKYIYKNGKYYMITIHRKYIGQTKTLKEAITLRDKKLKELEGKMRFEFNDDSQKICNSADVVNYGIQCDICGNKVLSVSNINGKRYCAGCYYKTFMKDNQKAEIDQLKQQLAEKDKEIKKLNRQLKDKDFTIKNLNHSLSVAPNANVGQRARIDELTKIVKEKDKEISKLQASCKSAISSFVRMETLYGIKSEKVDLLNEQFAEKDKEIEKLKQQYTILENENGKLTTELIMDKYKKAQKEVSFGKQLAIQELEKVKEEMDLNGNSYCEIRQGTSPHNPTDYAWFNYVKFRNYLNQQIKELKGE